MSTESLEDRRRTLEEKRNSKRRVLYIQARNLGDAVVGTGLIEALGRSDPDLGISVLTRPEFREIYENSPLVSEVFYASFPMGTAKNFNFSAGLKLARTVVALRRRRFDQVVHVSGDFRENLLGWMMSPSTNTGVAWENGHPQAKMVRRGCEAYVPNLIRVPADEHSAYSAVQRVASALKAAAPARSRLYDASGDPYVHRPGSDRLGLQPTASQECKLWPPERWRELISIIRAKGLRVAVFGAPADRGYLEACLPGVDDPGVEIIIGPLASFFSRLQDVRVLVGLDSFGIHAAHAIGTPTVMLYGANISTVWTPPGTLVVSNSAPPSCYPCMNRPTCTREEQPYSCIREIPVAAVAEKLEKLGVMR